MVLSAMSLPERQTEGLRLPFWTRLFNFAIVIVGGSGSLNRLVHERCGVYGVFCAAVSDAGPGQQPKRFRDETSASVSPSSSRTIKRFASSTTACEGDADVSAPKNPTCSSSSESRQNEDTFLSSVAVVRPIASFLTGKASSAVVATSRELSLPPWSHFAKALRMRDEQLGAPSSPLQSTMTSQSIVDEDFLVPLTNAEVTALIDQEDAPRPNDEHESSSSVGASLAKNGPSQNSFFYSTVFGLTGLVAARLAPHPPHPGFAEEVGHLDVIEGGPWGFDNVGSLRECLHLGFPGRWSPRIVPEDPQEQRAELLLAESSVVVGRFTQESPPGIMEDDGGTRTTPWRTEDGGGRTTSWRTEDGGRTSSAGANSSARQRSGEEASVSSRREDINNRGPLPTRSSPSMPTTIMLKLSLAAPPASLVEDGENVAKERREIEGAVLMEDGYGVMFAVAQAVNWLETRYGGWRSRCMAKTKAFLPALLKAIRARYPDAVVLVEGSAYAQVYEHNLKRQLNEVLGRAVSLRVVMSYDIDNMARAVRTKLDQGWREYLERFGFLGVDKWDSTTSDDRTDVFRDFVPATVLRWIRDPFSAIEAAVPFSDPAAAVPSQPAETSNSGTLQRVDTSELLSAGWENMLLGRTQFVRVLGRKWGSGGGAWRSLMALQMGNPWAKQDALSSLWS